MCLDRKDVRLKLSHDAHAQLVALAEFNEKDISEYASYLIERALMGEGYSVNLLAERVQRWGRSGHGGENQVIAGKSGAAQGLSGKATFRRVK